MEEKNIKYSDEVYKSAISFARMWGVMETLKPLPCLGFSEVFDMVTEWAQEYASCDRKDLVEFFQEKVIFVAGRDCMPNNYDFEITEDYRSRDDRVTKMRLENPYYKVNVYYMGPFNADRDSGGLDPQMLSVSVKPKKGHVMGFTYYPETSRLDNTGLEILPMNEVLNMLEPIKNAVESDRALRAQLDKILTPIRPRETK